MAHFGLETKYYKLEKLVKWEHVDKVNELLLAGVSPHKISAWCKKQGFAISHPKLYEYKEILQAALAKQVTVERLLGIGAPRRSPIVLQALGIESAKNLVKTEMEVLDGIIQRGFSVLLQNPEVRIQDAMKAIELKNKLTSGGHGGLTGYGLDELREIETKKFDAIVQVVLKYMPEDKYEEIQTAIADAEKEFYQHYAPQYAEDYEQSAQELLDEINSNKEDHIKSAMEILGEDLDGNPIEKNEESIEKDIIPASPTDNGNTAEEEIIEEDNIDDLYNNLIKEY